MSRFTAGDGDNFLWSKILYAESAALIVNSDSVELHG